MRRPPIEITGKAVRDTREDVPDAQPLRGGFARFHFTSVEITSTPTGAHVRSRSTRFENGRLTSESFEGETTRSVFDDAVDASQRAMLRSTAALFGAALGVLQGARRRRD